MFLKCLNIRWQTVPSSRSCNAESTFAKMEMASGNEQVIIVGRVQGDLAVESGDGL